MSEQGKNATRQIKAALLRGERLTGVDILDRYNIYRASSVIHKLRAKGVPIKTEMITTRTNKAVARYYISEQDRISYRASFMLKASADAADAVGGLAKALNKLKNLVK